VQSHPYSHCTLEAEPKSAPIAILLSLSYYARTVEARSLLPKDERK
jgi:hypothetical protein